MLFIKSPIQIPPIYASGKRGKFHRVKISFLKHRFHRQPSKRNKARTAEKAYPWLIFPKRVYRIRVGGRNVTISRKGLKRIQLLPFMRKVSELETVHPILGRYLELESWVKSLPGLDAEFSSFHLPQFFSIMKPYYGFSRYHSKNLRAYINGLRLNNDPNVLMDFSNLLDLGLFGEGAIVAYQEKFGVGDIWGRRVKSKKDLNRLSAYIVYLSIAPSMSDPLRFRKRVFVKHRWLLPSEIEKFRLSKGLRYENRNRESLTLFVLMNGGQSREKKMRDSNFDETRNFCLGVFGWNFDSGRNEK